MSRTIRTAGGLRLHVEEHGPSGATPVVMLHGITMSHRSWDWAVSAFGAGHRIVRPDARGHGLSDRAPGCYLLDGYVRDAIEVVEQVVGGPCVLVGHSLGGVTAAAVAQQRPDLVSSLLLEDPALGLARPVDGAPAGPLIDTFHIVRRGTPALQEQGVTEPDLARRLAGVPTPFDIPAGERYSVDALDGWAHGQLHLDVAVLDPVLDPPPDNLGAEFVIDRGIDVPTLVLAADLRSPDRVTSRGDEQRLVAASDDLQWIRVPGGGHNLHDEKDHRRTVRDHLARVLADSN